MCAAEENEKNECQQLHPVQNLIEIIYSILPPAARSAAWRVWVLSGQNNSVLAAERQNVPRANVSERPQLPPK